MGQQIRAPLAFKVMEDGYGWLIEEVCEQSASMEAVRRKLAAEQDR